MKSIKGTDCNRDGALDILDFHEFRKIMESVATDELYELIKGGNDE